MIKVCLKPFGLISPSMLRIERALSMRAPKGVTIVSNPDQADVQMLHVIGFDTKEFLRSKEYVVAQYCGSTLADDPRWKELWGGARFTWSYYDLESSMPEGARFLRTPLGIDDTFRNYESDGVKEFDIITSGHVTGQYAEAIQEVAIAVDRLKGRMVHIGSKTPEGWVGEYPKCWSTQYGISDAMLAMLYGSSRFVSGLRHVEGFEMPVIEGIACGARPIVFDRPDMRHWYDKFAVFIPESHGEELVEHLVRVLTNPVEVSERDRLWALRIFDWDEIAGAFWDELLATQKTQVQIPVGRRRILIIGDAGVSTGFAKGTHAAADALNGPYEAHVISLNHNGDPYPVPYPLYPAMAGGDPMGYARVHEKIEELGPAAVLIQNDPWNFPGYLKHVGNVPTIGWVAVDGKNVKGSKLAGLSKAIFWTKFGAEQCRLGGWDGPSSVIPLGVDLNVFSPMSVEDRMKSREDICGDLFKERGLPLNSFIVGSVGRNQWRKRLDLTIQYFAEWTHSRKVTDAVLWLQSAPTGDDAWDLSDLCRYYGIADRVVAPQPRGRHGMSETALRKVYNLFDALFVTSIGEGFHLPSFEAMACGTPIIASDWSAIGELLRDCQYLVPCTGEAAHPRSVNTTIGGVMDKEMGIEALDEMYKNVNGRKAMANLGLSLVSQERYRWETVGRSIVREVAEVVGDQIVAKSYEKLMVEA